MTASRGTRGPDFLVIGAQRSGTTWLHRVLRKHPELWLPPVKELHYFDQLTAGRTWPHQRRWRRLHRTLMSGRGILDPWHLRYVFGKRNDEWYASLFRSGRSRGALTGEITPAYARLDEETFERIRRVNPEVALIFVMRDLVNRAWSSVNAGFRKSRLAGPLTLTYALEHSQKPGLVARSTYTETIRRVEAAFSPTQIHYCFFDELKDQPERFVTSVLTFLGVNSDGVGRLLPKGAVNSAAGSSPIPFEFQHKIAAQYLPMVEELCQRFDGPPQKWRARYQKLLSKAGARSAT
jgi:hypothetical protein